MLQDEEDAKKGLYNWCAQHLVSRQLVCYLANSLDPTAPVCNTEAEVMFRQDRDAPFSTWAAVSAKVMIFCGMSCRFAQSQRLLTLPRLLFSTGTAMLIPLAVLGLHKAAIVWATVVLVTIASGYYATAIIGGVVGDYLGATIQVSCRLSGLLCRVQPWMRRAQCTLHATRQPQILWCVCWALGTCLHAAAHGCLVLRLRPVGHHKVVKV